MKISFKNIFKNVKFDVNTKKNEKVRRRNTNDNIDENITLVEDNKNDNSKRRRAGAAKIDSSVHKSSKFTIYLGNLFKNKNKLSRGYYALLVAMVILGSASVGITFKAYNLFSKEDYAVYSNNDGNTSNKEETVQTSGNIGIANDVPIAEEKKEEKPVETKVENTNQNKNNSNKANETQVKPLSFSKPLDGEVTKPYSIDKVIYSKTLELWKTHDGVDIKADIGTNVKSIEKGVIEKVYEDSFYGMTIVIDHGQGYKSSYCNLNKSVSVKVKQTVKKGQVIGKVSDTSIGEIKDDPHLHFMLFKDNNNIDPTYILK